MIFKSAIVGDVLLITIIVLMVRTAELRATILGQVGMEMVGRDHHADRLESTVGPLVLSLRGGLVDHSKPPDVVVIPVRLGDLLY